MLLSDDGCDDDGDEYTNLFLSSLLPAAFYSYTPHLPSSIFLLLPSLSLTIPSSYETPNRVNSILQKHHVPQIEQVDSLVRESIACPAFPLCGLAVAEAERRMPYFNALVRQVLTNIGMPSESMIMRMTGCPNGCARPYMAELALVGDGPDMYQVGRG